MKGKNHMYGVWKEKREAEKGADIAKEEAAAWACQNVKRRYTRFST